ncbi:hypothetical protein DUNSADRAFT_7302 [Dunaliella salina]|uniref:Secreted protein n=1 Tax=Dunaliella salina TaxID=3046 RepID=A0ABQ7GLM9_DUNSA|nr:hypothetical protein DUNSADRAFT_7302 [Dunaliella salina]|eukprot:KAF5835518.1 hypothetical protein DUNSADRAFT_7302 [Dunaliella salina]
MFLLKFLQTAAGTIGPFKAVGLHVQLIQLLSKFSVSSSFNLSSCPVLLLLLFCFSTLHFRRCCFPLDWQCQALVTYNGRAIYFDDQSLFCAPM